MYEVRITTEAQAQVAALSRVIAARVQQVFVRLASWPDVSGAKPLRHGLRGSFRVRTGDYRVLFTVDEPARRVVVFRVAHRRDVYED